MSPASPTARVRTSVRAAGAAALSLAAAVLSLGAAVPPASAQSVASAAPAQSRARRISVTWEEAPIRDVLAAFARFSGASIVAGSGVDGFVTADINDQPWDVALRAILASRGLVAVEEASGIIRVDALEDLHDREAVEPVVTRSYRISYARADELQAAIAGVLSPRGSVSVVPSTNTLVVTDIGDAQSAVARLLR